MSAVGIDVPEKCERHRCDNLAAGLFERANAVNMPVRYYGCGEHDHKKKINSIEVMEQ